MIKEYKLGQNIKLIVKPISHLNSVSYCIFLPGGYIADDEKTLGASLFLPEITSRGTKTYASKELNDKLDSLGLMHSESTSLDFFCYKGTSISSNIKEVLKVIFEMIFHPSFPEDEVANIRELCLQEILANQDNPSKLVIKKLMEKYHIAPFNRDSDGTKEGINNTTLDDIKNLFNKNYFSNIQIVLAGKVPEDIDVYLMSLCKDMGQGKPIGKNKYEQEYKKQYFHIDYDSEQTQIALASPAPNLASEDYYVARLTSELLSGGMFGRLFIEVREKRGLVYSVYNQFVANSYYGKNILYAGTTPKNAKETLSVSLDTVATLGDKLEDDEIIRAKNNLKSSIFISGESSLSQASNVAFDMWQLGHYRENEYIAKQIDKITKGDICKYLEKYPYKDFTVVSLGRKSIEDEIM